jgi:1-deoxy-D-xylulose-5-phosphate reductoisomerase
VGRNTLDVARHLGAAVRVEALAAGRSAEDLMEQIREFRPRLASLHDEAAAATIRRPAAELGTEVLGGPAAAERVATCPEVDMVMSAIVGSAGLRPTYAAVQAGHDVALANKEVMVVGGAAIQAAARRHEVELLPVDSEHNALHQCLRSGRHEEVRRLILTASGGPFWTRDPATFDSITIEEALAHPVWDMGPKISIDSATMMNKGLEVIEARWLFDFPSESIDIVVHPGSVVHSFVEYVDGSVLAQMGPADMRHPIQYALTWPERLAGRTERLDLTSLPPLRFHTPDPARFPCAGLAYRALELGSLAPAVLNGANEVVVEEFLAGRIGFMDIARCLASTLDRVATGEGPGSKAGAPDVDDCLAADRWGREHQVAGSGNEGRKDVMNIGFDNLIAFVLIFGILVFLHELGHFMVAKWAGIRVEVFSLGFGPRLFGWRSGGTDYRVSLVPLGGYVKMLGEEPEMDLVADPRDGAVTQEAETQATEREPSDGTLPPDSFAAKSRWQRFAVMVAGGVMNLILAVVILTAVNMVGVEEPAFLDLQPQLAGPVADAPAAMAGLQRGDRVVSVDGDPMTSWELLQQAVLFNPGKTITFSIDREGERLEIPVGVTLPPDELPQARYRIGYAGLGTAAYEVMVRAVIEGSPAEAAGLLAGDIIKRIDGDVILSADEVAEHISARAGLETLVEVNRQGETLALMAVPEDRDGTGILGIQQGPTTVIRDLTLGQAAAASIRVNVERVGLFFTVLGKLLSGGLSVRAISGPVDIFVFSGAALRRGWVEFLDLMALFSLQLGILNLLPVPFLDGGHIAVLAIEGIRRRDLSLRIKERILQVGFIGLLMLMGLVLYSDFAKNLDLFTRIFK